MCSIYLTGTSREDLHSIDARVRNVMRCTDLQSYFLLLYMHKLALVKTEKVSFLFTYKPDIDHDSYIHSANSSINQSGKA